MIEARDFLVKSVEAKPANRNPSPPFMTSTLQQEASRKLGLGAQQAMRAAQILYEQGHITYMRTDGVDMAFTKAANDLKLDGVEKKLYDLIWKRAVASQMESARLERTVVEIASPDGKIGLRATGQVVKFDGFLKVYEEGKDETSSDEEDGALPPPRYTEASLVKRMEELGIGRPSTYASIVTVIQDRGLKNSSTQCLPAKWTGKNCSKIFGRSFQPILVKQKNSGFPKSSTSSTKSSAITSSRTAATEWTRKLAPSAARKCAKAECCQSRLPRNSAPSSAARTTQNAVTPAPSASVKKRPLPKPLPVMAKNSALIQKPASRLR